MPYGQLERTNEITDYYKLTIFLFSYGFVHDNKYFLNLRTFY